MDHVDLLVDNLFRHESGRLVSAIARRLGTKNLALAEDVVQDALCRALEVWKFRGIPDNPAAWIMAVAKNRVLDLLRRDRTREALSHLFIQNGSPEEVAQPFDIDALFHPSAVQDGQLRMMFSCCHAKLSEEAQVALMLHILCGFSTAEIAAAFFSGIAAIEKRVLRGKKILAEAKQLLDLRETDVAKRLTSVQRALYLVFSEGYHGANPVFAVRQELCHEAMYLVGLLLEHPLGRCGSTYGLAALMCLNAARMPAREDASGNFVPLKLQDRNRWDRELILKGHAFLGQSAQGWELSEYQVEAAIASVHACAASVEATDWLAIIALYDHLLELRPSAIVALNRAIAIGRHAGAEQGLASLSEIRDREILDSYPFYWAALGEFELQAGQPVMARVHFAKAEHLARNSFERQHYARRVAECG
ncbi:MAG: sigma-70 family RNA polymerase sigma factor [Steroidobacteraceae bacterium]